MSSAPIPVVFAPQLKPRIWGGTMLGELYGKLAPGQSAGESWELVDLGEEVSAVARGRLAGQTLRQLLDAWGTKLHGGAALVEGRFPLLIKFLDACEHLSVQVHPYHPDQPGAGPRIAAVGAPSPPIKHEAWFVIHAAPGAELFIGLRPGVRPDDVARAANTPRIVDLLQRWPAKAGQAYYLPSGVPHALGAGLVVAEVQTPSDETYRLYDWDRVDAAGRPRTLHIAPALRNIRYDVPAEQIRQPRAHVAGAFATVTKLVRCESFLIDRVRFSAGFTQALPYAEMAVWIVLAGRGAFTRLRGSEPPADLAGAGGPPDAGGFPRHDDAHATASAGADCEFRPGDVVLIPADSMATRVTIESDCDLLEVKVPIGSPLADLPHPPRDAAAEPTGFVQLTRAPRGQDCGET